METEECRNCGKEVIYRFIDKEGNMFCSLNCYKEYVHGEIDEY
jgi:hypothetical protein